MHNKRIKEVHENSVNGFSEKNSHLREMVRPHNSKLSLNILIKFCIMKRANTYMKVVLMVFPKNVLFKAIASLCSWMWLILIALDPLKGFIFKSCAIKGAKRYMKIILMIFLKKIVFRSNGPFWAQIWCAVITLDPLKGFSSNFAQWKGPRDNNPGVQ